MKREWILYVQVPTEHLEEKKQIVGKLEQLLGKPFLRGAARSAQGSWITGKLPLEPHKSEFGIGYIFGLTDKIGEHRSTFSDKEFGDLREQIRQYTDKVIGIALYEVTATDVTSGFRIITS